MGFKEKTHKQAPDGLHIGLPNKKGWGLRGDNLNGLHIGLTNQKGWGLRGKGEA